jgi:hypothetical protein
MMDKTGCSFKIAQVTEWLQTPYAKVKVQFIFFLQFAGAHEVIVAF